ncbi:MAG: response regulator transcription factor [Patescibacteria group bacterium]|nr:response regulator transcription factor [Patescibacteria group bacterium]
MSKVLIVDDDVLSTQMYATKLQSGGHEVILSSDGEEALEKIKDTFDLILLDIMMPKIDGVALLKEIKKGVNKQTVILIMTNLISEEVKKECLENGATEFLLKADYNPLQLVEKIEQYLKKE